MIVHSIIQQMSDDGFGTPNEDLQMGVLPVTPNGKVRDGIAVITRALPVTRLNVNIQAVDFYVRDTNPLVASNKAQEILEYLQESFGTICNLPALSPYTTDTYSNVMITPVSSVEFVGVDENNGHSFVVSGEVQYVKD